ncbi:Tyrosine-protein phosphatase pmp1 [Escovopsis weberi]|uniref:protein-tyrosine-phosphatase n=1 Tax=Escovopsis weberi TaxID=150374 RepID=A0A0M8MZZ2_ESCWE|nr:Tyrosine-protein phosphatase pmp1 [Escovopsis weberi]
MKTGTHATFAEAIAEEDSPIKTQLASRAEFRVAEPGEDQKSPGYPLGPIAIYGDNVFLYSEPTASEASRFDVVINVAREVKNPFHDKRQSLVFSPVPDTAASNVSFATAFEYQPCDRFTETPTTPKASSVKIPEYIHMPWDHNTDIAPDLMHLCETIDNRTKLGKKVLVHCQQGASRSASLIIAYGLYLKPELSVNDAYYAAQAKSRWISPNMKLMYSLQDFHKDLL